MFKHACRLGAEGIVSKKVDGIYRSGPCPVWIKEPLRT
jgi:ATP-dependent DNA ligase